MRESVYNLCLLYRSGPLQIMGMQTNNTLILANNNFANKEEKVVRNVKIMTKDWEYFTPTQPIKFNRVQIKLDSNSIILIKESHIGGILLVTDHDANSTSSRGIIRKKLSLKE